MNPPCTTFANGINPFQGLGAIPQANPTKPEKTMQKPARKNAKCSQDEDYSTPYKPPVAPVVKDSLTTESTPTASNAGSIVEVAVPDDMINCGLTITDDVLPAKRAVPMHKYHPVFNAMKLGQCVRVPTANVGKVCGAMRKYIELKGLKAHVKSQPRYTNPVTSVEDVGFGRVWLMAGVSQMPIRKKAA